jgi:prepilin-type N-terminal cleavage/methylation domain-containing protein
MGRGNDMHAKTRRDKEGGFSLIELMIVMLVMSIIMVAVFSIMKGSLNVSNATYELTDTRENLRIAHEYINRDIINAGYELNDYSKIQVPRTFVTSYLAQNITPTSDPANTFGVDYINLGLVWSDADPGPIAVTDSNPAVTVLDNTDRITILRRDPNFLITIPAGNITGSGATITMPYDPDGKQLKVGEIYFFTSGTGTGFGRITAINTAGATTTVSFGSAGSYGLNKPIAAGPINVVGAGNASGVSTQTVNMRRAFITHYYVNSKNELMKREFGGAGSGFTENLVAEHITALSFRYILGKNNANGTVQQPVTQLTSWAQQEAVRQIEIKITGETTHSINFQKNKKGEETMTSLAAARNLQFRTAQQPKKP